MQNIREHLISSMKLLDRNSINCKNCHTSECCTYVRNSMQITPLEALEMIYFLNRENRINNDLITSLKDNIKQFRLDHEIPSNGKRNFSRRSYTCPFFLSGIHACSIDPVYKPYGCLAFNATTIDAINSDHCRSDQKLLSKLEIEYLDSLNELNEKIKNKLNINFEKLPISNAILRILENNSLEEIFNCLRDIHFV